MKAGDCNSQDYYKTLAALKILGLVKGGFVECLLQMWKLRSKAVRVRADILATGQYKEYIHTFGDCISQKQYSFKLYIRTCCRQKQRIDQRRKVKSCKYLEKK